MGEQSFTTDDSIPTTRDFLSHFDGRDAIAAAVNPAATEDLFFVADGTGGHAFAKTLEEHNENVARWRALEAQAERDGVTGVQGE